MNSDIFEDIKANIRALEKVIDSVMESRDSVYKERDMCVALIARMAVALGYKAGLGLHPSDDDTWDDEWRNIVYVDLPSGQISWHIHEDELEHFQSLGQYDGDWDGHSTEEKYRRVLNPGVLSPPE